jgi:two-component system cell cycle sensor histidine kinase/response regulator CckA
MAAAQKAEALGRLAAGVAHDFNNVLTIIMACTELQVASTQMDSNQAQLSSQIVKAVKKASNLTKQLVTFSSRQDGAPRKVKLNDVVVDMADLMERLLGKKIKLNLQLTEVSTEIHADPTQLEQVLVNLVANAKDAMPGTGSVSITTSIASLDGEYVSQHDPVRPGKYVRLSVVDTGCGMDRATMQHIFEPFFTTKADKGTGLGLATTYGIVKKAGGYVWAYSEVGQGTTFKIYLPALEPSVAIEKSDSPRTTARGHNLLVVDDDEALRAVTVEGLAQRGFIVSEAGSGAEALDMLQNAKHEFDILLTDFVMPGMDGHELCKNALQARPSMRVVLMSGYADSVSIDRFEKDISVIEKPYSLDYLATRLRALMQPPGVPGNEEAATGRIEN